MARSRSFSTVDTAEALADVFVAHGYGATSLALLEAASGLGKQSLYNAFGDKKAMYLQALDCAAGRWQAVVSSMDAAASGREALERFFEHLLQDCRSGDPARHTCIVSAGLVEGIADAEIAERLARHWSGAQRLLAGAVQRGQQDGSIASARPAAQLADHLMAAMSGLRVMARGPVSPARLQRVAASMLGVLDSG